MPGEVYIEFLDTSSTDISNRIVAPINDLESAIPNLCYLRIESEYGMLEASSRLVTDTAFSVFIYFLLDGVPSDVVPSNVMRVASPVLRSR